MDSRFGRHLTPEQLVDAADAVQDASLEQHLVACGACRSQVSELRATMSSVGEVNGQVPEPSPLFWDQFQRRVVEAVEDDQRYETVIMRLVRSLRPAKLVPVAAALIVAVGVLVTNASRRGHAPAAGAPVQASLPVDESAGASSRELLRDSMDDDPSLQLLADLAVDVDWNAADAASLAPNGSAEHAVSHMSARDLRELQRLLGAEIGS
jgi:predicted anti-sigma-YlaC factor YlaD